MKHKNAFLSLVIILYIGLGNNVSFSLERPAFDSYEDAIIWVRSNDNLTRDSVNTSKSSWIRAAEYYQDNSGYGFLILDMKGKEYIWEGIPKNVWLGFKRADSFGKYYHRNIKDRYYMELGE